MFSGVQCSIVACAAELRKLGVAVRVVLRVELLSGGDVEGGVRVAALRQDPAVLEQVEHLGPRHQRENREEDGEVDLLGRDQLPRLLPELEVDEEEGHGGGGDVVATCRKRAIFR